MEKLSDRKVVLVTRKTRLDELIVRFNSVSQARFYIEHLGADFSEFQNEHNEYQNSVRKAVAYLGRGLRFQMLDRIYLPNFLFGADDIVVALGQDGMVANTLKYLNGQPLIGVNPSPKRYDGVLVAFDVKDLPGVIQGVLSGNQASKSVTLGKVRLNDGQELFAVNDFFIGQKSHVSARYQISLKGKTERQSSSGIIVSTGLGSTGWLKSILAGAQGVSQKQLKSAAFPWDSKYLVFSVREPFPSASTGATLVFGRVEPHAPLKVLSQMPENGIIFSDGMEGDFLEFRSGVEAEVGISDKAGNLVVPS